MRTKTVRVDVESAGAESSAAEIDAEYDYDLNNLDDDEREGAYSAVVLATPPLSTGDVPSRVELLRKK